MKSIPQEKIITRQQKEHAEAAEKIARLSKLLEESMQARAFLDDNFLRLTRDHNALTSECNKARQRAADELRDQRDRYDIMRNRILRYFLALANPETAKDVDYLKALQAELAEVATPEHYKQFTAM